MIVSVVVCVQERVLLVVEGVCETAGEAFIDFLAFHRRVRLMAREGPRVEVVIKVDVLKGSPALTASDVPLLLHLFDVLLEPFLSRGDHAIPVLITPCPAKKNDTTSVMRSHVPNLNGRWPSDLLWEEGLEVRLVHRKLC